MKNLVLFWGLLVVGAKGFHFAWSAAPAAPSAPQAAAAGGLSGTEGPERYADELAVSALGGVTQRELVEGRLGLGDRELAHFPAVTLTGETEPTSPDSPTLELSGPPTEERMTTSARNMRELKSKLGSSLGLFVLAILLMTMMNEFVFAPKVDDLRDARVLRRRTWDDAALFREVFEQHKALGYVADLLILLTFLTAIQASWRGAAFVQHAYQRRNRNRAKLLLQLSPNSLHAESLGKAKAEEDKTQEGHQDATQTGPQGSRDDHEEQNSGTDSKNPSETPAAEYT